MYYILFKVDYGEDIVRKTPKNAIAVLSLCVLVADTYGLLRF